MKSKIKSRTIRKVIARWTEETALYPRSSLLLTYSLLVGLLCFSVNPLQAVPNLIHFQGSVKVLDSEISGVGQFKFAIVNAAGDTTYWSNDGSSTSGSEPTLSVGLTVSNGKFQVQLGDISITNMTAISSAVFENQSETFLRIWFDDGTTGIQQLTPDRQIPTASYTKSAGGVTDGAITSSMIANGAVVASKIAPGSVDSSNIASNAITSSKLASGAAVGLLGDLDESVVASGGMVLSDDDDNAALAAAGYIKFGSLASTSTEEWIEGNLNAAPLEPRTGHSAIWTGSEMIVWGGEADGSNYQNDGLRYDPASDSWSSISGEGSPSERADHSAIWTGTEMIVWGGKDGTNPFYRNDGARYEPVNDTWSPVSTINVPAARANHTVVWTGTEMIVWGGLDGNYLNSGARYNPSTDTWSATSASGMAGRYLHSAVWTGTEMVIWGGNNLGTYENSGSRYNPGTDSWNPVSNTNVPSGRDSHSALWTGTEMLIWGGLGNAPVEKNDGSRYNPGLNTWTALSTTNAPTGRYQHTAVLSGTEMIVWGGWIGGSNQNDGARYNLASNTWTSTNTTGAPSARNSHSAVWTGSEMIVWAGQGLSGKNNDGGRYDPVGDSWIAPSKVPAAPSPRAGHTAIWTGSEMIIWGGNEDLDFGDPTKSPSLGDGGRYDPVSDSWTFLTDTGAPSRRSSHTAIWTGSEMIVWGGKLSSSTDGTTIPETYRNDGARYDPSTDTWTPIGTTGAPSARENHTAVWTGSKMVVWGGDDNTVTEVDSGGQYDPVADTWTATSTVGGPSARVHHTAVWTGSEMIVWGGFGGGNRRNDGKIYDPTNDSWATITPSGAPTARDGHAAVWNGREMIIWGGYGSSSLNDGAIYAPENDSWSPVILINEPVARSGPTAVWTGNEMIVWGGSNAAVLQGGSSYKPPRQLFLYQKP